MQLIAKGEELKQQQIDLEEEDEALLDEIARKEQEYNEAKLEEWLAYMATYVPPTTVAPSIPISGPDGQQQRHRQHRKQRRQHQHRIRQRQRKQQQCHRGQLLAGSVQLSDGIQPFGFRESPTTGASKYHQGVDLQPPPEPPSLLPGVAR